jgi:hypothetical protein
MIFSALEWDDPQEELHRSSTPLFLIENCEELLFRIYDNNGFLAHTLRFRDTKLALDYFNVNDTTITVDEFVKSQKDQGVNIGYVYLNYSPKGSSRGGMSPLFMDENSYHVMAAIHSTPGSTSPLLDKLSFNGYNALITSSNGYNHIEELSAKDLRDIGFEELPSAERVSVYLIERYEKIIKSSRKTVPVVTVKQITDDKGNILWTRQDS